MKVFLISHIADVDGITPIVLTDLVFDSYDYYLLEPSEVDDYMEESLKNNLFDNYDKVFVTDLCFTDKIASLIDKTNLKNKIQVLDHHYSRLDLNKYSFISVIDEKDGKKESGTSLYYKYLLDNYPNDLLKKNSVKYMVDLVRSGDTWEWKKTNNIDARDLAGLLPSYGIDKFVSKYKKFFRENDEFYFDDIDKILIEINNRNIKEYLDSSVDKVIIRNIKGYRVGIIFAELYRSELGNYLAEYYQDDVDFIMIINMNRALSFRGIKDDVDVTIFAKYLNGYGHKKAAGAPLPEGLKESIIEYIEGKINDEYQKSYSR